MVKRIELKIPYDEEIRRKEMKTSCSPSFQRVTNGFFVKLGCELIIKMIYILDQRQFRNLYTRIIEI